MRILKYKKLNNNKYLVDFDNGSVELYEEVILKYELLLKREIDFDCYHLLLDDNRYWECYYKIISYIKIRSRSVFEVRQKLIRDGYLEDDIDNSINKLQDQGYLDDKMYANSFFNSQIVTTFRGPKRIGDELRKRGIDDNVIVGVIDLYDDDLQYQKVSKIISKMVKSNRSKSNSLLKKKLYTDLLGEGFSREIIDRVIEEQDFGDEKNIYDREYEKIRRKLSKKYDGYELERKIKEQMMRRGFYL